MTPTNPQPASSQNNASNDRQPPRQNHTPPHATGMTCAVTSNEFNSKYETLGKEIAELKKKIKDTETKLKRIQLSIGMNELPMQLIFDTCKLRVTETKCKNERNK